MQDYASSFSTDDRERVFRFFATFSRFECALKRGRCRKAGNHGQVEADWEKFANEVAERLRSSSEPDYMAARDYLMTSPPKRLCFIVGDASNDVEWCDNPRRDSELSDTQYLLRVIRDVRNNLFHGGKYIGCQASEVARDCRLVDSAVTVLEVCARLDDSIRPVFDEAA